MMVGGAALLAVLVARNDPQALLDTLARLSWRILVHEGDLINVECGR